MKLKRFAKTLLQSALILVAATAKVQATVQTTDVQDIDSINGVQIRYLAEESLFWGKLATNGVPFQSNTKVKRKVGDLHIAIATRGVVFADSLDDIAYIEPGGQLKMVSSNGLGHIDLQIDADDYGNINYRYYINHQPIYDQPSARQFLAQTLDKVLDEGSHGWRVNSLKYLKQQPSRTHLANETVSSVVEKKLQAVVDNYSGLFTAADMALANELLLSYALINGGERIWTQDSNGARSPFDPSVIVNKAHFATLDEMGQLTVYNVQVGNILRSVSYNLNSDLLLATFLSASQNYYQVGVTEKAMVEFVLRMHWHNSDGLQWLPG